VSTAVTIAQLQLPVPWLGSVNVWLLEGEPLTLVDTGPSNGRAAEALDGELARHGYAVEDIELVLVTHHHLDHSGMAGAIRARAGAKVAAHRTAAAWGKDYHRRVAAERRFTERLLGAHGVPAERILATAPFFDYISHDSADFETDVVLSDGDTIVAGGRTLRVVHRPGHSTSDTLFVDEDSDEAIVGDHLLAEITTGAEIMPTDLPGTERRRSLLEYLSNLRKTEAMRLSTCYPGHGPTIDDHRALIQERLEFHADRLARIERLVADGCTTAFEIARLLWSEQVAETQPVLVVWEVIGHLDILVNRGTVRERVDAAGCHRFAPKGAITVAASSS
jgi:glyoxylase-like metal-dependent hydrolase (beta-lactamase superfamily II)